MGGISMNENLDLTKILDECPVGTEFYHVVYGKVWFDDISNDYSDDDCYITFSLCDEPHTIISVTKKGTFSTRYDGECLIFPSKDQRDWSKFERFWDKPKIERFNIHIFHPFEKVLFRVGESPWRCGFFSHIVSDDFNKELVCTSYGLSVRCVPYNDETKHLVGTIDDCPDYYKWWEE